MSIFVGIDIGTTNTKAVAVFAPTDPRSGPGQNLLVPGSAGASYPAYSDERGRHELDPDQLLAAVIKTLTEIHQKHGRIAGISFSCAMHSLIAVDEAGRPLTKAITWADLRSEEYAARLRAGEAGKRIYAATGCPVHAMLPLCKLIWLREEQPVLFRRAAKFISIKEYIWWRLFGEYRVDHSLASATGLFDIRRRQWNPESLELAGISAGQLSDLAPSTWWQAGLLPEWQSLGLPGDLPFIIGGSDGCLANLGTGVVRKGDTALTIGTSGAIRMTTLAPQTDREQRLFSYVLSDEYYVSGGATNNGGNVLQWYAGQILGRNGAGGDELEKLVEEAGTVAPGCEGLVFLPYLLGERAPIWDARARGVFFGIRWIHQQRHFLRATLEGVSFALRQIGNSLEETIGPVGAIYASGGFTQSPVWLQLMADIFQRKVFVTGIADASAVGAALMGMIALGILPGLEAAADLVKPTAVFEPDAAAATHYERNYAIFTELYSRLKDLM